MYKFNNKNIIFYNKPINENEVPFISTYNIKSINSINEEINIEYYVTDWEQKEYKYDILTEKFTIVYSIDDEEHELTDICAGDNSINLGTLDEGIHTISLQAIDKYGRKSHVLYEEILVEKSNKNYYTMTPDDLTTYKLNNNNSENEDDLNNNRIGLNNFFKSIKNQGYDGCIMLQGIYRYLPIADPYEAGNTLNTKNSIFIPSEFIVDLNGSTIKQHVFEGHTDVAIVLKNTINSGLINGVLEGDYGEHNLVAPSGEGNNGEHCNLIDTIGGKFNRFENLIIKNSVGYTTISNLGEGYNISWDRTLENTDIDEFGNIIESNIRKTTSNYIDLSPLIDNNRKYMYCAIYLGYSGFVSKSWIYDVHFFDNQYKYIKSIRSFQYRATKIPVGSKYCKITFHDKDLTDISALSIYDTDFPFGNVFRNISYENTRTCAIAFFQCRNFLVENVSFDNCGHTITPIAIDLEDGWFNTIDLTFRNLSFSNILTGGYFLACSGHNIIVENCNCPDADFAFRGGWNGCRTGVFRNNTCSGLSVNHSYHTKSAFYRVYDNTIIGGVVPNYYNEKYSKDIPKQIFKNNKFKRINCGGSNFEFKNCEFDGTGYSTSERTYAISNVKMINCNIHDYVDKSLQYILFENIEASNCQITNCFVGYIGNYCKIYNSIIKDLAISSYSGNILYKIYNSDIDNAYFQGEPWSGSNEYNFIKNNIKNTTNNSLICFFAKKNIILNFKENTVKNSNNIFAACLDPSEDPTFVCKLNIINNQFNDITGYMITKYYSGHTDCPVLLKYINNIATPEILQMVDPQIQEKITIEYE